MTAKQTPLVDILRLHAEDLYSDYGHNKSARLLSQAADEIERLRSNSLALEDEKNDYMDGVGDVLRQDHDGETLWAAAQRVMSECDRLRAEVANRNQRALDGDKAKAAFDNVFDENERLRAELAKADGQINRCVEQNKYLESTISRLLRYAYHEEECAVVASHYGHTPPCDCGYDELIKEIGGSAVPFSESDRD